MPYHKSKNILFIHIPKNAGTAIIESLGIQKHGHGYAKKYAQNISKWNKSKKYAVIRNPWDRVVSNYVYAKMEKSFWHGNGKKIHPDYYLLKDKTFEETLLLLQNNRKRLKHQGWKPQIDYISIKGKIVVPNLLRYEKIEEDFKKYFPNVKLLALNSSNREKKYQDYYNDLTKEIVANIYKKDIETFNYKF